jgi:hypothetical protein
MTRLASRLPWVLVGALAADPRIARAEPVAAPSPATTTPGSDAEYHVLVDEALREYGSGHYEEARALFLRAHALQPSARTHRGIGLAEYELRNYPECITQLEAALGSTERPLTGTVRSTTQDVLTRAHRYVAYVAVRTTPADAQLTLDRVPVSVAPNVPLLLRVGEHLIEARADGYLPASRVITVLGGADLSVALALAPIAVASPPAQVAGPMLEPPPAAPVAATADAVPTREQGQRDGATQSWRRNPWLWGAVGVVVVGAAVGGGIAMARSGGSGSSAPDYPVLTGPP